MHSFWFLSLYQMSKFVEVDCNSHWIFSDAVQPLAVSHVVLGQFKTVVIMLSGWSSHCSRRHVSLHFTSFERESASKQSCGQRTSSASMQVLIYWRPRLFNLKIGFWILCNFQNCHLLDDSVQPHLQMDDLLYLGERCGFEQGELMKVVVAGMKKDNE